MTDDDGSRVVGDRTTSAGEVGGGLRILVIEDDPVFAEMLRHRLRREGHEVECAADGAAGLAAFCRTEPQVVLLDVRLPDGDGREILKELRARESDAPVVVMTTDTSVELAVECMKLGACDFVIKPLEPERLRVVLRNADRMRRLEGRVRALEGHLGRRHSFADMVAASPAMRRCLEQAAPAATCNADILILGENGVGKEVLAGAVHYESARRRGPFVAVNCGAIPETLLESELFGHEKGAFTGAISRRAGCFEQADGGTLFLDEIAEMRPDMQVRLLRVLEERAVRRVGGDRTVKLDVRVISATNQDIAVRVREKRFRKDLYYRLAVIVLEIPPLRKRPEDVGPLVERFIEEARRRGHTRVVGLAPEALRLLERHDWPGNVRELRNAVERALVYEQSEMITVANLPPEVLARVGAGPEKTDAAVSPSAQAKASPEEIRPLVEEEKRAVLRALDLVGGNISEAARRLGINRNTLHRKLAEYKKAD